MSEPADAPLASNLDQDLLFEYAKKTKGTFAAELIFTVLLNVLLFSLFILLFFFVLAAKVEKNVVKTSVTDLVRDMAEELKFVLPESQIQQVAAMLAKVKLPDMSGIDKKVTDANAALTKKAIKVLGTAAAVVLVVIVVSYFSIKLYAKKHSGPGGPKAGVNYPAIWKVLRLVLYSFIAVIITELVFLGAVAAEYEPLDKNKVKLTIIQFLQSKAKKPE